VLKSTPIFNKVEGAIDKVISGYRVTKMLDKAEEELIQVESPSGNSGGQWIEQIYQAIINKEVLLVRYHPFNREAKEHLLSPYLLKEYRNRWYVIGHSNRADAVLVFAMDRIQEVITAKSVWVKAGNFSPQEYFRYSFGITQVSAAKPQRVVLSFSPLQAQYILSQPLHHSQQLIRQNDKEVRIELRVYLTQELLMMILGYGTGVKVIAPKKLVDDVKGIIRAMIRQYP